MGKMKWRLSGSCGARDEQHHSNLAERQNVEKLPPNGRISNECWQIGSFSRPSSILPIFESQLQAERVTEKTLKTFIDITQTKVTQLQFNGSMGYLDLLVVEHKMWIYYAENAKPNRTRKWADWVANFPSVWFLMAFIFPIRLIANIKIKIFAYFLYEISGCRIGNSNYCIWMVICALLKMSMENR